MKLRNKKTGEIGLVHCDATMFSTKIGVFIDNNHIDLRNPYKIYTSLAELNEEWEDYEEPKEYWYIDTTEGTIAEHTHEQFELTDKERKEIGNYFETEEEAEKAVEKLKAWKRLKDKGFKFSGWEIDQKKHLGVITIKTEPYYSFEFEDLDLLFGGEE